MAERAEEMRTVVGTDVQPWSRVKGAVTVTRVATAGVFLFFALAVACVRPVDPWLSLLPVALSSLALVRSLFLEVRVSSHGLFVRSWLKTYRFAADDIVYVGVGNYDGAWVRGGSTWGPWSVYVEIRGPRGRERVGLEVTMSGRRRAARTVRELKEKLALETLSACDPGSESRRAVHRA